MSGLYGVMGNPIAHSLSPQIHQQFAEQTGRSILYEKISVPIQNFENDVADFFARGGKGLNITLPFKERAYAMADVRTTRCEQALAANTLWQIDGILHADNTDGIGLLRDLKNYIKLTDKSIVLLGAGGAAKGVLGSLLEANPKSVTLSNRTFEKAERFLKHYPTLKIAPFNELSQHTCDLIINATSSSLSQQNLSLPTSILTSKPFCYDLAYRQQESTPFVHWAKSHQCQAVDGIGMLIEQAAEAFLIWHGILPETRPVHAIYRSQTR